MSLRTRKALGLNAGGVWGSAEGAWVPLYEGKMVQAFDHRASGITTVDANLHRSGQGAVTTDEQRHDPNHAIEPRYFILDPGNLRTELAIKDVTSTTNTRSLISCIIPPFGAGHTLPILRLENDDPAKRAEAQAMLVANLNSMVLDFVARTKILSNHASWYILEQLPVIPPAQFGAVRFGPKSAAEIVREAVLELTYTAHDMAPFARDLGHVDDEGTVKSPFIWDDERRLRLRAKLDALFFHLYSITDREDIRYIYSTFPIVERQERAAYNTFRSMDLCLAYFNMLAAGQPDAKLDG